MHLKNTKYNLFLIIPLLLAGWVLIYMLAPGSLIKDENLEAAIREEISYERGEIRPDQLVNIEELRIRDAEIEDLGGIEHLTSLISLDLQDNNIRDISLLGNLTNLKDLNLRGNQINKIDALENLTSLIELNLRENTITDISPLQNLQLLEDLNIRYNSISDLEPLKNLESLRERLYLEGNPIYDFTPIMEYANDISDIDFDPAIYSDNHNYLPVFSHAGGFYNEEFILAITSPLNDALIYFTIDGSEPDPDNNAENTYIYTDPLTITELTSKETLLANIPTTLVDDWRGWNDPGDSIPLITVIRAIVVDENEVKSKISTQSYFINKEQFLPVISINTNPENFFDEETGIYVPGVNHNSDGSGNYYERGREWERPMHIEFFEQNGRLAFSQDAGVRIHGNFTRRFAQKSLRLYSRSDYGDSRFNYQFFDTKEMDDFNRLILRNSGNDWGLTMFRDAAMQNLVHHLDIDSQHYRPVVVYINGEYWGIHNIRDRLDKHYLETHYGADRDDFTMLYRELELQEGEPGDEAPYQEMLDYISENNLEDNSHYEHVQTLMDVDNYIQHFVIQIYNANTDWPHNNIRYWRYNNTMGEANHEDKLDGRWRWLLFDVDRSLGYVEHDHDTVEMVTAPVNAARNSEFPNFLLRELLKNDDFKQKFLNVFADHLNSTFLPERVVNNINDLKTVIEPEIENHINRWGMPETVQDWYDEVDVMREFALNRPEAVREHIINNFNLEGTANLQIISDTSKGIIQVNSTVLDTNTPGITNPDNWTGEYFMGVPISVKAIPAEGYTFNGWGVDFDETSETIQVMLTDDLVLQPVFEEQQ